MPAVYEYQKGCILNNVSISQFEYLTARVPKKRYVIQSARSGKLEPHLLWTEGDFNYFGSYDRIRLIIRTKPASKSYKYYLVKFQSPDDMDNWMRTEGGHYDRSILPEPKQVDDYFRGLKI